MVNLVSEMTWQELKDVAAQNYLMIIVVGSTEQHGPHLPLSTDVLIPMAIAEALSKKTKAVIAPPFSYGYYSLPKSGGGESFPGTTSIGAAVLIQSLREVVSQFIRDGFKKFLILNGHWENITLIPEAIELAFRDEDVRGIAKAIVMSWSQVIPEGMMKELFGKDYPGGQTDHASVTETSMMMYLYPRLVRKDKIPDTCVKRIVTYDIIPESPDIITPSGALWTAKGASKKAGKIIFNSVINRILQVINKEL